MVEAGEKTDDEKKADLISTTNSELQTNITNNNTKKRVTNPPGISGETLIYYHILLDKHTYYLQQMKQWLIDNSAKPYADILKYLTSGEDKINLTNLTNTFNYRIITHKYIWTISGTINNDLRLKNRTTHSFIKNTVKDISSDSIIYDVKGEIENLNIPDISLSKLLSVPLGVNQVDYYIKSYLSDLYREPYNGYNYLNENFKSLNNNIIRILGQKTKSSKSSYTLSEIVGRFIKGLLGGIVICILLYGGIALANISIYRPIPFRIIYFGYGLFLNIIIMIYLIVRWLWYKKPFPKIYAMLPLIKYDTSLLPSIVTEGGVTEGGIKRIIDERKWYYKIIHYIEDSEIKKYADEYRVIQETVL